MPDNVNAAHLAAKAGKRDCLEVALACNHYGGDPKTLQAAIEGGHLPCVQLLFEQARPVLTQQVLVLAAERGQASCVAYLAPLLQNSADDDVPRQWGKLPFVGEPWRTGTLDCLRAPQ
jgi:hypothetical protein